MTKHQFKRGDRVFVCQVGFSGYGQWDTIRPWTKACGPKKEGWYIVGKMCTHESWLNREKPDAALDNPLCRAA